MRFLNQNDLKSAIEVLEQGDILGVPTETVYGLAVKADDEKAIQKLMDLKNRQIGSGKVLTMMVADVDQIDSYAYLTTAQRHLARHYFPGELTLILPKLRSFKHPYFNHFKTIGIRIPEHKYMLKLLRVTGPLLVTSANPRGEAPCRNAKEVAKRLPSLIAVVKGEAGGNLPSTIIDFSEGIPQLVRQGGLLIVRY